MRLYLKYLSIHFRSAMTYKLSFAFTTVGQFFVALSAFAGVYFIMRRFDSVGGFSAAEVFFCFALVFLGFSAAEMFFRGFDTFPTVLGNGEFDRIMLRPGGLIFQVLAHKADFTRAGRFFEAAVVMAIAVAAAGIRWTVGKALLAVFMLAGATAFYAGCFLLYASVCFYTTESLEILNILTDGTRELGQYPISVYGKGVLRIYTFVIPIACAQYYPLLYLLGRESSVWHCVSPAACFAFLIPCYVFWRVGVRHYKSTGS